MIISNYITMIQSYNWKPDQLFFFDKNKSIRGWRKRQKRQMDSLPITLLRDTRISVTFAGEKAGNLSKGKREAGLVKGKGEEEGEGEQLNLEQSRKVSSSAKKHSEGKWMELEYEEEEDTQRFLFEEAKFSAPSLLAQIEKFLIFLLQQKTSQREELEQLNEEIEAVYGQHWDQSFQEEGNFFVEIPDELFRKLCCDFEQFAEGTVCVIRKWQTNVYRELAALHELRSSHNLIDFQSVGSSPDLASLRSPYEKHKTPIEERESKSSSHKIMTGTTSNGEKNTAANSDLEQSPTLGIHKESKVSSNVIKPRARVEKFKTGQEKDKGDREKSSKSVATRISTAPHGGLEEEITSIRAWESNFEKTIDSHVGKRKEISDVSNGGHKTEVTHNDLSAYNQNLNFLPGSVINFSLASRSCHDKGWVFSKGSVEDLEQKNILEWVTTRLQQVLKQKEEEESKLKFLNENGPLIQRYYGDSKRETTIRYKKGVAWAKFITQKKNETSPQLFLTTLPDGSCSCFYPSGRVAVMYVKCKAGNQSFYTIAYSDEPNPKMLATFTPQGRGCCNYSEKVVRFLATRKEAIFNDERGILVKRWKWAYGKMMNPEMIQLNDGISIRCVSQSSIVLVVNINGEVAKFPVSPFPDAPEQDPDNLGYLMTNEVFSSRGAVQSQQPRKKTTREERRAKNQKREMVKNNNPCLSEESLAERLKDLDEKFPERKDMDFDAPYLLELQKIQRKVRNIVFEWMEHYRSAVGISRPSKLSLLMKKRKRLNSANSLPGSMPSFSRHSTSPLPRAPSAPPVAKSLTSRANLTRGSSAGHLFENRSQNGDTSNDAKEQARTDVKVDVPQLPKTTGNERQELSAFSVLRKSQTSESSRLKTPRTLILPKEGCPVALHAEFLGEKQTQCRCDKRRIPYIMDLEYDIFIKEHVPKTQLIVISIVSSRLLRTACDDMLDDLYYEKNKTQTLLCTQSRFDPYRLLRYDLAAASHNNITPLLVRRHNVAPGMFLMYSGGKLLFADYIFNGYGNAKRDLLNQIMRTRKDSMAGNGLAQDFRFNTRPAGRIPRTAWGSEINALLPKSNFPGENLSEIDDKSDFNGFPALLPISEKSTFAVRERDRRKNQTSLLTYNRISNLQY